MSMQRTDLAVEAHELWRESSGETTQLPGVKAEDSTHEGFPVHTVTVLDEEGAQALGKPMGRYITLELDGLIRREEAAFPRAVQALAHLIAPLIPDGDALVAGLGNRAITPDLIGPLSAEHTLVTRHLVRQLPQHFGAFRPTAVLTPGVLATTGVESGDLIRAAVEQLHPTCVIAVDALASRSVQRLCRTIQIADTGITPGSGVGNHRVALDRHSLGVPVIAIGVPTVVEAATLAMDLLGREDSSLTSSDLFVTPREIDMRVSDMARVIGYGISMALTPGLSLEELEMLLA